MVVFPNAKVNFGLNIVEKRADGFHEIESIFYPIGISDALEVNVTDTPSVLRCHGSAIPGNTDDNLIMRAWKIMKQRYALPEVAIDLVKHMPMGGGIGGGSADCGFFINLINSQFSLDLSIEERELLAAELGSDCPFFIQNIPVYVSGRGEKLEPVAPFLKGYYLVLVYGDLHISTKEAYAGITPRSSGQNLKDVINSPVENWRSTIKNDFEAVVFAKYPELAQIKEQFYQSGAVYASLSGTGSCLYGLYKTAPTKQLPFADKVCWSGSL